MTLRQRFDEFGLTTSQGAAFLRDLEGIRAEVYEVKTPPLSAMLHIPQSSEAQSWQSTYTRRMLERFGAAKIISDYADDLPLVGVGGREDSYKVKEIGAAYQFSRKEMLQNAKGIPLRSNLARACRRAIEEKLNRIAWYGDPAGGLFGKLNFPFIPRYLSSVTFNSSSTAADKLAELHTIAYRQWIETETVARPDTMLVSTKVYADISSEYRSDNSDATVLDAFLASNEIITSVEAVPELSGAGPNGEDLIVVYRNALENGSHQLAEPFTQLPEQERNLAVVVNCVAQSGGYATDYPQEITIAEVAV